MENKYKITEYFRDIETSKEHNGYFCSIKETLTIMILGCFCGLRNVKQIINGHLPSAYENFWQNNLK